MPKKPSFNEKVNLELALATALDSARVALINAIDYSAQLGDDKFLGKLVNVQRHLQDAKIK